MAYLVFILSTLALLIGFVVLTQFEVRRGARFCSTQRERFDAFVGRIEFIVEHVDLLAFLRDEVRHATTRAGHVVAHLSLQAVRSAERLLTRAVRHLRTRHEEEVAPRETAREFVKTLSDFKEGLNAVHPELNVNAARVETEEKAVQG